MTIAGLSAYVSLVEPSRAGDFGATVALAAASLSTAGEPFLDETAPMLNLLAEAAGLVRARGRRGTVVADVGTLPDERRVSLLADAAARHLAAAKRLGITSHSAVEAVRRAAG